MQIAQAACLASDVQTFCPDSRHPPSARSARVVRLARSEPAPGSLKSWTSLAKHAAWAICIARTDPDVPRHDGITYFLVDMASPGITVRPLKEMTGDSLFNEVFIDDVFVPG